MNKSDRMQLKAVCVIFGILVLVVAAISLLLQNESILDKEKRQPVVLNLYNTYITEVTADQITVFDGTSQSFFCNSTQFNISQTEVGQICNLTVTDGVVSSIQLKNQNKINEKVISVESGSGIELENSGYLACTDDVKIYLLYGEMRTGSFTDIRIGYSFADFVLEDDKICAVLLTRDEFMDTIRVLIKNSDYQGNYHERVELTCDADYSVRYKDKESEKVFAYKAGESFIIDENSEYQGSERIYIVPSVLTAKISLLSVNRSQGVPAYRGNMEISKTDKGYTIVNEVLLEEYLYGVVPSEMPSSYPMEALKAQAICARTYAYMHMLFPGLSELGAHVDDSTGYQVYNNIADQSTSTDAVKETAGLVLYSGDDLVNTFYYSTSCGVGSDEHVWKTETDKEYPYLTAKFINSQIITGAEYNLSVENMTDESIFTAFINSVQDTDFERNEPWYRWNYDVTEINNEQMLSLLKDRYASNKKLILTLENDEYVSKPVEELGKVKNIYVEKRNAGGIADEMIIVGEKNTFKVISEYNIRYVLCDRKTKVTRQDGSQVDMNYILPSAFFEIEAVIQDEKMTGYHLRGGGFGHGAGMSQNGAKKMAEAGYSAKQILEFFYQDSIVQGVK